MDIGKSNDNFKDGKSKCFNCNKYRHIGKGNADQKRRNEKHKRVLNATRRGTLPKTVKGNR